LSDSSSCEEFHRELYAVSERTLRTALGFLVPWEIALALSISSEEARQRVLGCLPAPEESQVIRTLIDSMGRRRVRDIEEGQQRFLEALARAARG